MFGGTGVFMDEHSSFTPFSPKVYHETVVLENNDI